MSELIFNLVQGQVRVCCSVVPFLNLISPFGLMRLLDVETQPAINDIREAMLRERLIDPHRTKHRTGPVVIWLCVKHHPHLIC